MYYDGQAIIHNNSKIEGVTLCSHSTLVVASGYSSEIYSSQSPQDLQFYQCLGLQRFEQAYMNLKTRPETAAFEDCKKREQQSEMQTTGSGTGDVDMREESSPSKSRGDGRRRSRGGSSGGSNPNSPSKNSQSQLNQIEPLNRQEKVLIHQFRKKYLHLGLCALQNLDITTAWKAYNCVGTEPGMVFALQTLEHAQENKQLLAGHVHRLLGNFRKAQEVWSQGGGSFGRNALELQMDLNNWRELLPLAEAYAPHTLPVIYLKCGQQCELRKGEFQSAVNCERD
jgi:hypothetical protein